MKMAVMRLIDAAYPWLLENILWFFIGLSAVLVHKDLVTPAYVRLWRDKGIRVMAWTVNDPLDGKQRTALFCEMKILSNIDLHLNLINMLGSCTTEFVTTGEVFMLLEFCKEGENTFYTQ